MGNTCNGVDCILTRIKAPCIRTRIQAPCIAASELNSNLQNTAKQKLNEYIRIFEYIQTTSWIQNLN